MSRYVVEYSVPVLVVIEDKRVRRVVAQDESISEPLEAFADCRDQHGDYEFVKLEGERAEIVKRASDPSQTGEWWPGWEFGW